MTCDGSKKMTTDILSRLKHQRVLIIALLTVLLFVPPMLSSAPLINANSTQGDSLSNHWRSKRGCYQDELNQSDTDYYNCWTDNAGKILTMAELTNDTVDATHALAYLQQNGLGPSNKYLPEAVVTNSSVFNSSGVITNRIAELSGTNHSTSDLKQLAIGNYYAGQQILGYVGSDRILINGVIKRSQNSSVFETQQGFVKESFFNTTAGYFKVYLNTTLSPGDPYAHITLQVLSENVSMNQNDLLFIQVFSSQGQFDNATLYDSHGNFLRNLGYNAGSPAAPNGTIIAYSKQYNVFGEDGVALNFAGSSSSPISDLEHWYQNAAFDSLSWIGVAYKAPDIAPGVMSLPIVAKVYPIEHLDYHLLNDTAKYISENVSNSPVSPPVGFGFVAYGLSLASANQPENQTLASLAKSYWNYYYTRYAESGNYGTPYARSINTLALAGFELYGCNSTVESFTRNFLGNTSGASIEEYGWAVAALYQLKQCTGSPSDVAVYDLFRNSYLSSDWNFLDLMLPSHSIGVIPSYTFQYGEAASGLMLGSVPYNNVAVLQAMDAVYQSNVSGTLLNQPYHGDLANTETIPAILLSSFLFQNEMRNETGYWITGLQNANITSIDYYNGTLLIGATGNNGKISLSSVNGSKTLNIYGAGTYAVAQNVTTSTTTTTTTTTTTKNVTVTEYCSLNGLSYCSATDWSIIALGAVFLVVGVSAAFRSRTSKAGK